MPVPTHIFDPPFNIIRCSHAVLDVVDLNKSRAFYENTVGLHVEDSDDKAVYLRGSEEHQHHSLVLRKAPVAACSRLGFRLTEYGEEDGPNGRIAAAWMHRKGNVHDFAITNGRGPRLHHFAYWTPTAMNILHLCDVMASSGYLKNIERGPGRHGISNAFFLYVRDPDGHRLELYTSDYFTGDHDHEPLRWSLKDPRRQTLWGAPAPRSWFEEGTPFTGQAVREPAFVADVTIAD